MNASPECIYNYMKTKTNFQVPQTGKGNIIFVIWRISQPENLQKVSAKECICDYWRCILNADSTKTHTFGVTF